ncbi:tyrosine-type recombinase/integrase [Roseicella frigidaeris]|uniref:Tyr recombinase domain-containing protein n=1 Tax=Roseicella frigidaeris TaxID=2230885 RepID=A0A327LWJ3_9PROT|nr:tyrosine-type recombinase/integrase [Roseicella frigidaeris]RAI54543.1 hypothetical protein DOO78_26180 [Roseicella frigidaeris]
MSDSESDLPLRTVHTVIRVRRAATRTILPLVIVRKKGDAPRIHWQFLEYALELQDRGAAEQTLDESARVFGMMVDYHEIMLRDPVINEHDLASFLGRFLQTRYRGAAHFVGADAGGIEWKPVRWTTVKHDMRRALGFFEFCVRRYGHYPAFRERSLPAPKGIASEIQRKLAQSQRDFLFHLHSQRDERRDAVPGTPAIPEVAVPGERRRPAGRITASNRGYFPEDRVEELIERTPNIVHRMIWIAAAFGGPRISEQLNLWVDDVLPGATRPRLFPDSPTTSECVIVLADPAEATYTGSLTNFTRSRLQILAVQNRTPRNVLHRRHPEFAGWKGVSEENEEYGISQVYWIDRRWAAEYFRLYRDLLEFRAAIPSQNKHPWLYINIGRGSNAGARYGAPLTMSNVRKAFEAACERIGLTPYRGNASLHKLRSLYRRLALNAGLTDQSIQHMMHHKSHTSQEAYGRARASQIFAALDRQTGRRLTGVQS